MFSVSQTILKSLIPPGVALFLVLVMGATLPAQSVEIGEITAGTLNLRSKPALDAKIVGLLTRGTRVEILAPEDGWLRVRHGGKIGYVANRGEYIRILSEKEVPPSGNPVTLNTVGKQISDQEQIRLKSEDIHRKMALSNAELRSVTQKESEVLDNLNQLDRSLNKARKQFRSLKAEVVKLESLIRSSQDKGALLINKIGISEDYASQRIVALYKLSLLGKNQALASADSISDFFRRQKALEHILASDEDTLDHLWQNKRQLQEVMGKQAKQIQKKRELEAQRETQVNKLAGKRKARSALLTRIRTQKSLKKAALNALRQADIALNETMKSFSIKKKAPAVTPEKGPEKIRPLQPFSLLKGLLKLPVKGSIINSFGPYTNREFNGKNYRSGIDIQADRGEPVHAVSDGNILYANWFKGYGNMMIIDHGEHYYTVYAHIEELFKSKGDTVETDEVVATVGDTGSRTGSKLYFEIRHHGKAIDPLFWIRNK